jgi:integrase
MRTARPVPAYRLHKATGQAVVVLRGRSYYLGKFGTPQSRAEYNRLIAEYLTAGNTPPPKRDGAPATPDLTVVELIQRYWEFAERHYVRDGNPARELDNIKDALRHLRPLYGLTEAARFGPLALKAVRQTMINAGLCRNTINSRIGKLRRMFKWAVAEELIPPSVLEGLKSLSGLSRGRGGVRETKPVRPVEPEQVEAVLPFVSKPIRAMIQVQNLTGMRPGEVMALRSADLDRSGDVWIYRPGRHKTQDKGFSRAIPIGPKAQEVLAPWLNGEPAACVFSPAQAVAIRNAESRAGRKSPMTPSQAARRPKANPKRPPRQSYDKRTYHTAVERACDKAFPHATLSAIASDELTEEQKAELLAWRKSHRWHPNRLRHSAATRIRRAFDLESAQVVLGHAKADVTQVYAERDLGKAVEVMREIG